MGRKKKSFHDRLMDIVDPEIFEYVYIGDERTNFMISSHGRLFSLNYNKTNKIKELRTSINKDYHKVVVIKFRNKNYMLRIHRLVAIAFIPNLENKQCVHHIDGNPLNNFSSNLMWVTEEEHVKLTKELDQYDRRYGESSPLSKYSDEQIEYVCKLLSENKLTMHEIEKETGVPYYVIQFIRYRDYSHKNIKIKYNIDNYNTFDTYKYSDDQIHNVCKLLELNKDLYEISEITGVSISMVRMIKLRKRRLKISRNYKF